MHYAKQTKKMQHVKPHFMIYEFLTIETSAFLLQKIDFFAINDFSIKSWLFVIKHLALNL